MGHYMRGNVSTARPQSILYLDTETKAIRKDAECDWHVFRMGVTCYAERDERRGAWRYVWKTWHSAPDLLSYWDSLVPQKKRLFVVVSNPIFDLWVLDAYRGLYGKGWRLVSYYDKGLTHVLRIRKERAACVVLALQNFYPTSIKAVGDIVGLQKLSVDFEQSPPAELEAYCKRDVDILRVGFETWLAFVEANNMGGFALTRTGQAMRCYRHRYMTVPVLLHGNTEAARCEREAYHGGRVECFVLGVFKDGPFVQVDVHSMYPYIMATSDLPRKLYACLNNVAVSDLKRWLQTTCMVADVSLDTDKPAYAVVVNDKLCFPIGSLRAWLTTPGVRYALNHGHVVKVHKAYLYDRAPLFQRYMRDFYKLRQGFKDDGNAVYSAICKYILNGFYGKWAQQTPVVVSDVETESGQLRRELLYVHETGERLVVTEMMGREWIEQGKADSSTDFVAIAAHVTEAARLYLWELIDRLKRGRVLYCDTDSIILRESDLFAYADVLDERRMGALSVQCKGDVVCLYGLKDYTFGGKVVRKGIRREAVEREPGVFEQTVFPRLYSLLPKTKPGEYPIQRALKRLARTYDKAETGLPAGLTRPFVLEGL